MSLILLGILNSQVSGAAAGAYDLLETQVLTSSASSVTFTGLGSYSDYKHLQIRYISQGSVTGAVFMRMNSDSGSNYAHHYLRGRNGSVGSGASTSDTSIRLYHGDPNPGGDVFGGGVVDILDFSNTSKNTTTRALINNPGFYFVVYLLSGLWNNTAAVTSIDLIEAAGGNFVTGSRFSLYGVK